MNEKLNEQTKVLYEEEKQTEIKVVWKDNGVIMATLICTADKMKEMNDLINFIRDLSL